MATAPNTISPARAISAAALDNRVSMVLVTAAGGLTTLTFYAFARWYLGFAPETPWVRSTALTLHLATVIPAIPLGAYVLFAPKGGKRHKLLGRIWLALMTITAIASFFVRNINPGQLSWIHIFTLLTFIAVPQAIITARQGKIREHRKHLISFYTGALLLAGITAFSPGRTMWQWAFG